MEARNKWQFLLVIMLIVFVVAPAGAVPKRSSTVAELALYKGPDRQQILEEGAKKEGKLTFYTTGIHYSTVSKIVAGDR